jgi:hypothetical protein
MYYDRRLFEHFLDALDDGGPMQWLRELVRSEWGDAYAADLHFRGDREGGGYFELYFGRTSPLRVRSVRDEFVLEADPFYAAAAPGLFGVRLDDTTLAGAGPRMQRYLNDAGAIASTSLIDGEGRLQGMLGRTHGLLATGLRHGLVLDREVVLGHQNMEEKRRVDAAVRAALGAGDEDPAHNKLDAVALLDDGRTGLVEIKPRGGDLAKGALQLVAYRMRFQALAREWPTWASSGLSTILRQKSKLHLLPKIAMKPTNTVVPVLASMDDRIDWADTWRSAVAPVMAVHADALDGLVFWRVGKRGEILEAVTA